MLRIQGAEAASGLGSDIQTVAVLSQLIAPQSRKEQQDDSFLVTVICIESNVLLLTELEAYSHGNRI